MVDYKHFIASHSAWNTEKECMITLHTGSIIFVIIEDEAAIWMCHFVEYVISEYSPPSSGQMIAYEEP